MHKLKRGAITTAMVCKPRVEILLHCQAQAELTPGNFSLASNCTRLIAGTNYCFTPPATQINCPMNITFGQLNADLAAHSQQTRHGFNTLCAQPVACPPRDECIQDEDLSKFKKQL